jgi:hypothetical protein
VSIPGRWEWVSIIAATGARHGGGSRSASHLPWHTRFVRSTSGRWEQIGVATAARVRHGDGTWGAGRWRAPRCYGGAGRVADGGRHGGGPKGGNVMYRATHAGNELGAHFDESSCHGLDGEELHGGWIEHMWA